MPITKFKEYTKCAQKFSKKNPWLKFRRPKFNRKLSKNENNRISKKSRKAFVVKNKDKINKWKKHRLESQKKCKLLLSSSSNSYNYSNTKCCKCRYVKNGKTLRKVRGTYGHCSYDMDNCCKDKKTIINS